MSRPTPSTCSRRPRGTTRPRHSVATWLTHASAPRGSLRDRMRPVLTLVALLLLGALIPALAGGHAERATYFPDPAAGSRPDLRKSGPSIVVCKRDSAR